MDEFGGNQTSWGPKDYWHTGPVYVRKHLVLLALIALSSTVLLIFGFPLPRPEPAVDSIPSYRYNDPALAELSGLVQVLDDEDRVRYIGEVAAGAYTGRGKVFNKTGELLYDGPLVDGVYEGADAKVYQDGTLVYNGEMAANLYEGQGRRIDPVTGTVSEGQFSRGLLEGQGQEFHANGVLLREGTFSAGRLHGEGRAYTTDGNLLYEGQFWRGVYHGQGTLYNTQLNVPSAAGTFVHGTLAGQGDIYHPSGQLLYTGQVYEDRPRADAFLGLSLAEVEEAFAAHWTLYSCEGVTAFVYPYFNLMFLTESPIQLVSPSAPEEPDPEEPILCEDEILAPDTDKRAVLITQVLSYGQPLPCVAQPETDFVSGQHSPGWREWFSAFALGGEPEGASVRQSGPFVWRFTPWPQPEDGGDIDEFRAGGARLETVTVYKTSKDMPLWYQTAQWKEAS